MDKSNSSSRVQGHPRQPRFTAPWSRHEARVHTKGNTAGMVSARLVRNLKSLTILFLTRLAKPETKKSLPIALMRCLWKPFLAAVIPRLFLILFRYSQPTLIKECIRYAVAYPAGAESSHGYWLVVLAVFIYVSLAVRSDRQSFLLMLTFHSSCQPLCTNTL